MFKKILIIFDEQFLKEVELICQSLNFEYKIVTINGNLLFCIANNDYENFIKNLNEYINENILTHEEELIPPFPVLYDKISVFSYFLIFGTILFYFYYAIGGKKYFFFQIGANDAYNVVNGEFYRCVTSLFLHANILHLSSNIIFFSIIFKYVIKILGEGLGWFLIIIAGATGNFLTSFIYGSNHSSIGFSTSVFATLGILANLNFKIFRNYLPVIGAFFLLIMLGGGDKKIDVLSHVTGIISGYFLTEILIKRFIYLISLKYQNKFRLLTLFIIFTAWISALHNNFG